VADHQACRGAFRSQLAFAAQALGFGERGPDVGHADVEDDVGRVAGAAADAARDAGPVGGRDAVDEAVVFRLRYGLGDRGAGVELPAEQLTEVVPELLWVFADDLEVHDRVCHDHILSAVRRNDCRGTRNSSAGGPRPSWEDGAGGSGAGRDG
jgi:hypothetical protein